MVVDGEGEMIVDEVLPGHSQVKRVPVLKLLAGELRGWRERGEETGGEEEGAGTSRQVGRHTTTGREQAKCIPGESGKEVREP